MDGAQEDIILLSMEKMARKLGLSYHQRSGGKHDLEDLCQVARLGLLEGIRTFDPSRGMKLTTHAYNRARYALSHYLQGNTGLIRFYDRKNPQNAPLVVSLPERWEEMDYGEDCADLKSAEQKIVLESLLAELDEKLRRVVQRIFLLDRPCDEVARALGVSRQSVYNRINKAISTMKNNAARRDITETDLLH